MDTNKRAAFSITEWENFDNNTTIEKIKNKVSLPEDTHKIETWRDENYKIKGKILGEFDRSMPARREAVYFEGLPEKIEGSDRDETVLFELNDCQINNISCQLIQPGASLKARFEANLLFSSIEKRQITEEKATTLTEWYLNGPEEESIFPHKTIRQVKENYIRRRLDFEEKTYLGSLIEEYNSDFAYIDLGNKSFIVQAVPKYLGPEWSSCIGIEYHENRGGIPNEGEREAIGEIVSFVLGKELLNVGYTMFSEGGYPIVEVAKNPSGDNVVSKCQKPALFPIDIDSYQSRGLIEIILVQLVPSYLSLRKELNLNQALWCYWTSLEAPLGANLPILAAGVETIAKSWFKTNNSKTKGVYIGSKLYSSLLSDEFELIERKLGDSIYKDKILNKIKTAYNMGANDRLEQFFSEIELPIGELERKAIIKSNSMKHGDIIKPDDFEVVNQLTFAYQNLFNRILLKLLGYDGDYIDMTTSGLPSRHINEPT